MAPFQEFDDSVQGVFLYYFPHDHDKERAIFSEMASTLETVKGEPAIDSTHIKQWIEGDKQTTAAWNYRDDFVVLGFFCVPLLEETKKLEDQATRQSKDGVF